MSTPEPLWITKLQVAERQLREAIRLFFERRDPVTVHTVAAAGHQVLVDIAGRDGVESLLKPKAAEASFIRSVNYPTNFFKHADRDAQGRINIRPLADFNAELLMDAVLLFQRYAGTLFLEGKVFWTWFVTKNRELFEGSVPSDGAVQKLDTGIDPEDFDALRAFLLLHDTSTGAEGDADAQR